MSTWRIVVAAAAALPLLACGQHGQAKQEAGGHGETHAPVPAQHGLPSKAEIAALFDEWNATLQTGGPHDMALLYAEDGVLLPTVSNEVRSNRAEIANYFEHFLQLKPRGAINEQHIDVLDWNTAVNSGVYTFDVVKNGEPTFVVARHASRVKRLYQDSEEGEVGVPVSVAAAIDAATARDVLSCREELVEKAIAAYLQAHPRGTEGLPKDWQTTLALAEQQIEGQVKDAFRDNFVGELAQSERAERDQQKDR
ncbi:MAG: SgcJ/EcaC family oxidoreductase, partial [Alphaproteobacteria bacterium]|nr:SgcJ/EcaC family oxidoreductase [Alphaproteobacteria bacterium]